MYITSLIILLKSYPYKRKKSTSEDNTSEATLCLGGLACHSADEPPSERDLEGGFLSDETQNKKQTACRAAGACVRFHIDAGAGTGGGATPEMR